MSTDILLVITITLSLIIGYAFGTLNERIRSMKRRANVRTHHRPR